MRGFIAAIFIVGVIRFALTITNFPDSVVKYFSMTVVSMAGVVYFGIATGTHKERLKAAYLLILPYMVVEVAALGYTWASGRQTIFHSTEYSFGVSVAQHTLGHLIGGVTWEPLTVFVVMEVVWLIAAGIRRLA